MAERTLEKVFEPFFTKAAAKPVSETDKRKRAYVLSSEQQAVVRAAGIEFQEAKQLVPIRVVSSDGSIKTIEASVYSSKRSDVADRRPEPRMGKDIIGSWISAGDSLLLATNGEHLYAMKNPSQVVASIDEQRLTQRLAGTYSDSELRSMLPPAGQPAKKSSILTKQYIRSPIVAELVRRRAAGKCEYPGCRSELFRTVSGQPFLEVHHIQWLRNGGADSAENAAALCPNCHRAQHHAVDHKERTDTLRKAIADKQRKT
jgi:hypothetical protein